jgi:hypothetical protein
MIRHRSSRGTTCYCGNPSDLDRSVPADGQCASFARLWSLRTRRLPLLTKHLRASRHEPLHVSQLWGYPDLRRDEGTHSFRLGYPSTRADFTSIALSAAGLDDPPDGPGQAQAGCSGYSCSRCSQDVPSAGRYRPARLAVPGSVQCAPPTRSPVEVLRKLTARASRASLQTATRARTG